MELPLLIAVLRHDSHADRAFCIEEFFMKFRIVLGLSLASVAASVQAQTYTGGVTVNQNQVATALNTQIGVPNADRIALNTAFAALAPVDRSAALLSLTPSAYSLLPDVSLNAVETQETAILRYMRDLRGNAERPNGDQITTARAGRVGTFASGNARFGSYRSAADRSSVANDEYGAMGGINFRASPKILVGAYGGYSVTDAKFNGANVFAPSNNNAWYVGGYGTGAVGPVYVDLWGGYTELDWTLSRASNFGLAQARTSGNIWTGGGAFGTSFSAGKFEFEPYAAVRYSNIRINGFTEVGTVNALNVAQTNAESLRLNLGGRIGTKFEVGNGTLVRPQFRGGWYKEFFLNDPRIINAAFVNPGAATPFSFVTTPLSSEYYNVGAALNIAGGGPVSFVVDYDVKFDQEREFHALSIAARLKF